MWRLRGEFGYRIQDGVVQLLSAIDSCVSEELVNSLSVCVCKTQVTQLGVCVVTQGTQSSLGGVGAHAQSVLRRD